MPALLLSRPPRPCRLTRACSRQAVWRELPHGRRPPGTRCGNVGLRGRGLDGLQLMRKSLGGHAQAW